MWKFWCFKTAVEWTIIFSTLQTLYKAVLKRVQFWYLSYQWCWNEYSQYTKVVKIMSLPIDIWYMYITMHINKLFQNGISTLQSIRKNEYDKPVTHRFINFNFLISFTSIYPFEVYFFRASIVKSRAMHLRRAMCLWNTKQCPWVH